MSTPRDNTSTPRETTELLARLAENERAHHERKVAAAEALRDLTRNPNMPPKWAAKLTERHDGTTIGTQEN
ncbi:hypothetical protein [Rhodococcus aetherivorans]|uniref:hypothetical protein n=1 Tax=Rhodococcus aetherivorans TaxID=191292 RepID=UPI002949E0BA|nr:hypothetical protein [Rhodococcus aetherivorans]MDV6292243.1 hypothetical protein [Rhodococcus aetherivorans]